MSQLAIQRDAESHTENHETSETRIHSQQECFEVVSAGVVEHLSSLRAFARSLTSNRSQADDLVHDAVLRALSAAHQFTPGTNFKAWIFTILRNLFYNEGRKPWSRHMPLDELVVNEPAVRANQEQCLAFCDFRRAFWQLAPEYREVLVLVGASGMSYEAASAICNCPIGTVKSRVSRARRELKDLLERGDLELPRSALDPVAESDLERVLQSRSSSRHAAE